MVVQTQTIDSVLKGRGARIDAIIVAKGRQFQITLPSSLFDHFQVFFANIYQYDNERTKKLELSIFQEIKQNKIFSRKFFIFIF